MPRTDKTVARPHGTRAAAGADPTVAVYEWLRGLIVRCQLAPGARLVEREIADRLGTSRTPVRGALHRLQQERYVTVVHGGKHARLVVAPLTVEDVWELFEVVGSLEGAAAHRAATLPAPTRTRLSSELTSLNKAMRNAAQLTKPDQNEIFELDTRFHRLYVEAGAGPRILALHDAIKPQAERYVRLHISALVDQIAESIGEHDEIINGLRSGDADLAERAVLRNWRNAAARFSEVIARLGELGTW